MSGRETGDRRRRGLAGVKAAVPVLRERFASDRRRIFLGAVLVAGAGYCLLALRYPLGGVTAPGPGFLPLLTGVALCAFVVFSLLRQTGQRADHQAQGDEDGSGAETTEVNSGVRTAAFAVALVVYVILLASVGHIIASVAIVLATLLLFRARPLWQMVLFAAGMTAASYVIFDLLLNVPLPTAVRF